MIMLKSNLRLKYRIYVGVIGQIAAGKGILVDYLIKKYGFTAFSLSAIIHAELKKRQIKKFDRKILQDIGDQLRQKYGNDILARRAMQIIGKSNSNVIIDGIRNQGEIHYLKTLPNFILIGVKATRKLRFRRILKRAKAWDPTTWQQFMIVDRRDQGIGRSTSEKMHAFGRLYFN